LLIKRERQDKRNGKTRTVGKYQVFHDGLRLFRVYRAPLLSHPGQATIPGGNRRRVEAGKYPLRTQAGTKFVTLNYTKNTNPAAIPRPGLELAETNMRREILIHPGRGSKRARRKKRPRHIA
jgi:hypothetical protein